MDTTEVTVIANIHARIGDEDALRALLLTLVTPTRAEPGCLSYQLHQSADNPAAFAFVERWRSSADLERHLAGTQLQDVIARAASLVSKAPEITLWNEIG